MASVQERGYNVQRKNSIGINHQMVPYYDTLSLATDEKTVGRYYDLDGITTRSARNNTVRAFGLHLRAQQRKYKYPYPYNDTENEQFADFEKRYGSAHGVLWLPPSAMKSLLPQPRSRLKAFGVVDPIELAETRPDIFVSRSLARLEAAFGVQSEDSPIVVDLARAIQFRNPRGEVGVGRVSTFDDWRHREAMRKSGRDFYDEAEWRVLRTLGRNTPLVVDGKQAFRANMETNTLVMSSLLVEAVLGQVAPSDDGADQQLREVLFDSAAQARARYLANGVIDNYFLQGATISLPEGANDVYGVRVELLDLTDPDTLRVKAAEIYAAEEKNQADLKAAVAVLSVINERARERGLNPELVERRRQAADNVAAHRFTGQPFNERQHKLLGDSLRAEAEAIDNADMAHAELANAVDAATRAQGNVDSVRAEMLTRQGATAGVRSSNERLLEPSEKESREVEALRDATAKRLEETNASIRDIELSAALRNRTTAEIRVDNESLPMLHLRRALLEADLKRLTARAETLTEQRLQLLKEAAPIPHSEAELAELRQQTEAAQFDAETAAKQAFAAAALSNAADELVATTSAQLAKLIEKNYMGNALKRRRAQAEQDLDQMKSALPQITEQQRNVLLALATVAIVEAELRTMRFPDIVAPDGPLVTDAATGEEYRVQRYPVMAETFQLRRQGEAMATIAEMNRVRDALPTRSRWQLMRYSPQVTALFVDSPGGVAISEPLTVTTVLESTDFLEQVRDVLAPKNEAINNIAAAKQLREVMERKDEAIDNIAVVQ